VNKEHPIHFTLFSSSIDHIKLPDTFTYPFYYEPHELCRIAADELQNHRLINHQFDHNFGLDSSETGMVIGKMFGVLVVQSAREQLGYLSAFSGKLADSNHHEGFVPPIYDMLVDGSRFNQEIIGLNEYNRQVEELESDPSYHNSKSNLKVTELKAKETIAQTKAKIKAEKAERKTLRIEQKSILSEEEYTALLDQLENQSIQSSYFLKDQIQYWKDKVSEAKAALDAVQSQIDELKRKRKTQSNALQQHLFQQYRFLNADGEEQDLLDIFSDRMGIPPPAGSGECAAPKLLNYAYQHQLKPIAMAEFWWGQSPKSQVRKHKQFYPACRSKCEPILGHMLRGLDVDPNPIQDTTIRAGEIEIIHEDEHIVVINKPPELLSVPGKIITDSVWSRMRHRYPQATGPLIVHRLDMSTSGIMIVALTKEAHKYLQYQFIKRTAEKRYLAILKGSLSKESGYISLPLRVDLDNRPHQLVCYDHGKNATTYWELNKSDGTHTWVDFYPKTGRTHQLRVHAAHSDGLNAAIVGDDLYGDRADRLYLHAAELTITHPVTKQSQTYGCSPSWDEELLSN
jgi:tRNA pseudouridine32 synthase/23S rRNA pseudouridine746 synthase